MTGREKAVRLASSAQVSIYFEYLFIYFDSYFYFFFCASFPGLFLFSCRSHRALLQVLSVVVVQRDTAMS